MRTLVTGSAGFIGSTLARQLLDLGHSVRGIDCFTDYYDPMLKWLNVQDLLADPGYELVRADLAEAELRPLLRDVDVVFHLAGQPGVRGSWADGFGPYVELNVLATQRLLEAATQSRVNRFVYASSSSVYGNAATFPCREHDEPQPFSPYGVTKLAGEHLVRLYASNYGLPTVALRYFTVFGPRQRPEMAMSQLIEAGLTGTPFRCFAAPGAVRDFTYVEDTVAGTVLAGTVADIAPGTVLNVAGGTPATMNDVIDLVGEIMGSPVQVQTEPSCAGDVLRTGGDHEPIRRLLGWRPSVGLHEGLARQVAWHRRRRELRVTPQRHTAVHLPPHPAAVALPVEEGVS